MKIQSCYNILLSFSEALVEADAPSVVSPYTLEEVKRHRDLMVRNAAFFGAKIPEIRSTSFRDLDKLGNKLENISMEVVNSIIDSLKKRMTDENEVRKIISKIDNQLDKANEETKNYFGQNVDRADIEIVENFVRANLLLHSIVPLINSFPQGTIEDVIKERIS